MMEREEELLAENEKLKSIYTDFAIIRRSLIDYGFMKRNKDCTEYWIKAKVK